MTSTYAGRVVGIQWRMVMAATLAWLALACLVTTPVHAAGPVKAAPATPAKTVLVMGDSLSAGFGIAASQSWVSLTGVRMAKTNPDWRVVNASISGETTSGGAARIDAELKRLRPQIVVIALGANDGLRGLPLAQTKANLDRMIQASQAAKARVLLVGMHMPPNYGRDYTQGFAANYTALAKQHAVPLVPFLLEPIMADRANFQDDNLHPVASAQPAIRDHVWKALAPMLK